MESNWSQQFLYKDGKRKVSPIILVFAAIQVILLIIIIITIIPNGNDTARNDAERYERLPELTINGLSDKVPELAESEIANIQKKVFEIVSENTNNIKNDIEAEIRDDDLYAQFFDDNLTYLKMIIDIPSLEQSYDVFYSSGAVLDPEVSTFVLCLDESSDLIYENFECKSSDDESIRDKIVAAYLGFFKFDYFSPYISPDDPDTIVIGSLASYDYNEETKIRYIKEVKSSVESLGFSSSNYEYYVRTAADINYDHQD